MKWKASSWPRPSNTFISSSLRPTLWISTKSYLIPRHTLCGERIDMTTDYRLLTTDYLMQVSRYLSLILLGMTLDSCSERQFDSKTEGEKLLARDAEWADLATAGKDIEKVVSYWADDAVLIFPGQPVLEGKAAIRAYVTASFNTPGFKIHWVSQRPEFSPDGKLAYMRGTDELTVPGSNGGTMTIHLRGISVWRLDPDKQWRCVVDISNEGPPTTPNS